jgi:hypothetical protein
MQVLSGCKEAVVLAEDEGMVGGDVLRSRIPDTAAFAFDPFDAPAAAELRGGPRRGWHGVYKGGDLLFLPGNSLHHVRNACPDTVAVNVRPWRHSTARATAQASGIEVPFSTRYIRENTQH